MPTAYIIPGFHETTKNPIYSRVSREFKKHGFSPKIIVPTWKQHTMSEYVTQVASQLPEKTTNDVILSFSFGAYVALLLSAKKKFRRQFLCSVSPYFTETVKEIKPSWRKVVGERRMEDFKQYKIRAVGKSISTPTSLFVGGTEGDLMIHVARDIYHAIPKHASLQVINDIGHKIRDQKYYSVVFQEITKTCSR